MIRGGNSLNMTKGDNLFKGDKCCLKVEKSGRILWMFYVINGMETDSEKL